MANPLRVAFQHRASAFVAGVVLTLAVGPSLVVWLTQPYAPLGNYPVPQAVLSRVPGVEGPAVLHGQPVRVRGLKCNDSAEPVAVTGATYAVREDPRQTVLLMQGAGVREPGCHAFSYANLLPPEVGPGRWRLEGFEEVVQGSDRQRKAWYSEWFEVVP